MRRLIVLVPVLLFGVTACGGTTGQPQAAPTKTTTTAISAPPVTTTSAAPAKPTLQSLVADPCKAITDDDAAQLNVILDGSTIPSDKTACQWGAQGALVQFNAYPKQDRTKQTNVKNIPTSTISGHRAKLGTLSHGSDSSYVVIVAVGSGSFQLIAVGFGPDTPGPDPLTVAKNFAKVILKQLG